MITLPVLGTYNVTNALAALSAGLVLGISLKEAAPGLAGFQLTKNRTEWMAAINGSMLLNDSYNANPTAMKAVLTNFSELAHKGRKIVVLGDMLELGEHSQALHISIKEAISADKIDQVFLYGHEMQALHSALIKEFPKERLHYFTGDKEPMIQQLKQIIQPTDFILVKSSLGTDLLSVVRALQA